MSLKGKTLLITGASRGIGHAIALRAAKDGANIIILAKTEAAHPKLPGTIYSAAEDIKAVGGNAVPLVCDIRFEEQVEAAVAEAVQAFGGIDICVNNASAISLTPTLKTEMKRFDLMMGVNARGTFLVSKHCIPHLKRASNPHILNISPPLNMKAKWFKNHVAYTMAKYGMSMCTLGMSAELERDGIAVNSLWPETAIATAAVRNLLGGESMIKGSRNPEIMAEAAYAIFNRPAKDTTGNFYIDVNVLKEEGVTEFGAYAVEPGHQLVRDFFLDDWAEPAS